MTTDKDCCAGNLTQGLVNAKIPPLSYIPTRGQRFINYLFLFAWVFCLNACLYESVRSWSHNQ